MLMGQTIENACPWDDLSPLLGSGGWAACGSRNKSHLIGLTDSINGFINPFISSGWHS